MKFTLLNHEIDISDGRKNYMQVLHHFRSMAQKAAKEFRAEYNDRMGLVFLNSTYSEKFLKTYGSDDYMDNIVMRYVGQTRNFLTQYGVYDLSDTEIWNKAIVTEDRSVSHLQYEFNSFIVDCLEREEEDSVFISRIKSKFEGSFFDSCLHNDVMALCDFTLNYLEEHNLAKIQFVYKDDAQRAKAIYQNLKDSSLTEEQMVEIMCAIPTNLDAEAFAAEFEKRTPAEIPFEEQITLAATLISLDPRERSYFECIFKNIPTARHEIAAMATHLGHDLSNLIEEDIRDRFNFKNIRNEEDALKTRADIMAYLGGYGLKEAPILKDIEVIIHDYDLKARTYEGVTYETRELRAKAEADDKELYSLYAGRSNATKDELLSYISQINGMQADDGIKKKHISQLQIKIQKIEETEMEQLIVGLDTATEQECTVMVERIQAYTVAFAEKDPFIMRIKTRIRAIWKAELDVIVQDVHDMSEDVCNTAKQKIQQHCAPDEMKREYIDYVNKRIHAIWDAEDFNRFSVLYKQTPVGDSAAAGQTCALIQKEGRTEIKELFIKALYLLNEAEVAAAVKYALAKESGMFASLLNMGKKESYMILTLNGRLMHPAIEEGMKTQKEAKGNGLLGGLGKLKNSFGFGKTASKACPNCGTSNSQSAKFCNSCGAKID